MRHYFDGYVETANLEKLLAWQLKHPNPAKAAGFLFGMWRNAENRSGLDDQMVSKVALHHLFGDPLAEDAKFQAVVDALEVLQSVWEPYFDKESGDHRVRAASPQTWTFYDADDPSPDQMENEANMAAYLGRIITNLIEAGVLSVHFDCAEGTLPGGVRLHADYPSGQMVLDLLEAIRMRRPVEWCDHCGHPFFPQRPEAKYCSTSCKGQAATYRQREAAKG